MNEIELAYARYNMDYDKDYIPLLVSGDHAVILKAIKDQAEDDGNKVNLGDVDKYAEYLCADGTTMYGIESVVYQPVEVSDEPLS